MSKKKVLIVDDELDMRIFLSTLLETSGYQPFTTRDGLDGVSKARTVKPDIIILDVMMPGMDGFEVCRRLKDDPTTSDIPIIFITALNETKNKVKGFSVGCVDYVTKPFQPDEIRARVDTHLELCRAKRELQQSYDKLHETETQRDGLVQMIVHDMRSPIFAILGNLEMAEMEPLPKGATTCIDSALSATGMLMEMISTLLDVGKMEAGKMTLDFSAVDISDLAGETIRMLEPLRGQRRLTIASPEKMEIFAGDTNLIRRVLQNLISNALKFTDKDKGIITVFIEIATKDKTRVSVVDNGNGIPLEYREKVFDKFCQVAANKQSKGYSTGLGLTFCKLAVEAHGGGIGLESEMGGGSTFWFELPLR